MRSKELSSSANFLVALFVILMLPTSVWAANEKVLRSFVAFPRGANPQSNLIADAAGNLYGTTASGGRFGYGTVFELAPGKGSNWNETVLYNFRGESDGGIPVAGLVFDDAGNLYGTTETGGIFEPQCGYFYPESSCGVVFELSPGTNGKWTESVLHSFTGSQNDGRTPTASLIFDNKGDLFGTTEDGGTYDSGTVFELTPGSNGAWTETVVYDFTGNVDGGNPEANLIFDSTGNVYGTTEYGGDLNCNGPSNNPSCGTVFKLTPNGDGTWSESVLHAFTYVDGAYPFSNLVFDSSGDLYGTTTYGPGTECYYLGCGTAFELAPNSDGSWTLSTIYNFEGATDGHVPVAGMVLDGSGHLYGTTEQGGGSASCSSGGCGTVFELTSHARGRWTERVIRRFDGTGLNGDGIGPMGALLLDRAGSLYGTTSSGGNRGGYCSAVGGPMGCGVVFKLNPRVSHEWILAQAYAFPPGIEGIGPSAGLVADNAGNLYGTTTGGGVNDQCITGGCGAVFQLKPASNGLWSTVALHNFEYWDGAGPEASLTIDSSGSLYGTTSYGLSPHCQGFYMYCGGTVFRLDHTPKGWKETVLHSFRHLGDGKTPLGGVILDSAGNLYGTTSQGGNHSSRCFGVDYGCGTVFKLSPTGRGWREELLYVFQGRSDGSNPTGTLMLDEEGALYGTTCGGGANGDGTVFELTPGSGGRWTEHVLYSFQGQNGDGSCPRGGLITNSSGDLFGTTSLGGNYAGICSHTGCGVVFELSPKGVGVWKETVLLAFQGTDGSNPNSTLTFDAAGNLYGAAPDNTPQFAGGMIFELSPGPKGWTEHVLHNFGKGFDGAGPNGPLIFDSSGNILGTTFGGGTAGITFSEIAGTAFELSPASDGEWVYPNH
jgi:uncharacterized repeat protein (TIGR03803 family)